MQEVRGFDHHNSTTHNSYQNPEGLEGEEPMCQNLREERATARKRVMRKRSVVGIFGCSEPVQAVCSSMMSIQATTDQDSRQAQHRQEERWKRNDVVND